MDKMKYKLTGTSKVNELTVEVNLLTVYYQEPLKPHIKMNR